jgi:gallate decarboxylase subunit D
VKPVSFDFTVTTDQGSYDLSAAVKLIGNDLLVAIWGGEKPHIGAVATAQPRPSLRDPSVTSSTASVFCYVGHKEDELAKAAAEVLAAALKTRVVVTAGIHWDNLSQEGIRRVVSNSEVLVDLILDKIATGFPSLIHDEADP